MQHWLIWSPLAVAIWRLGNERVESVIIISMTLNSCGIRSNEEQLTEFDSSPFAKELVSRTYASISLMRNHLRVNWQRSLKNYTLNFICADWVVIVKRVESLLWLLYWIGGWLMLKEMKNICGDFQLQWYWPWK